ncbi:MAG TPA: ABC transporter ATP-binding protein [Methanoregulaceae archaeon]|nr:ABC transporter ATP-binding protein [Methanoregulaceae archaeon]HPD76421.1 ABC transporter ATP-binding protein [Methanoregulaceae archaeon]
MRSDIYRAIRLVFSYTPRWTVASIVLVFILGVLPLASLYVMKLLVDTVTSGVTASDRTLVTGNLTMLILAAAGIAVFTAILNALTSYVNEVQSLVMSDRITALIQTHSLALDLQYYENPAYYNTLHRAQAEGPSRPGMIVNDLVRIAQSCISITAIGALIISFSPVIGLVLVCAAIPAALVRVWYSKKLYALRLKQTEAQRRGWYYHWLLTDSASAKEIRLYGLGPFFQERFSHIQEEIRAARLALSRSRAGWDITAQGFVTVAIFGSFSVIAFMTIEGSITPGDMVMYFMGFQMCISYTQNIFGGLNSLYEDQLFLRNLFEFFDLKPRLAAPEKPIPLPAPIHREIRMEGISFTYADKKKTVLNDISITLHAGEVIALVGENGAGKSTLIKLFCRLYEPDRGRIMVDGIDLAKADPQEWQKKIAILFQDYVHYYLTAQENIGLADVKRISDVSRVEHAAQQSDADSVIRRLPAGYQTTLGYYFNNGHELSIGEWQKVALARAFFRDAEIVILDEPASSLDALAEADIFGKFKTIIQGRSAILISHRFSTVLMADHIYVLENGRIAEHGSHADLMAQNGRYAKMFHAQADPYSR